MGWTKFVSDNEGKDLVCMCWSLMDINNKKNNKETCKLHVLEFTYLADIILFTMSPSLESAIDYSLTKFLHSFLFPCISYNNK